MSVQALKSNMQKKTIDNMLSNLKEMTAKYGQPSPDKKVNPLNILLDSHLCNYNTGLQKTICFVDCNRSGDNKFYKFSDGGATEEVSVS